MRLHYEPGSPQAHLGPLSYSRAVVYKVFYSLKSLQRHKVTQTILLENAGFCQERPLDISIASSCLLWAKIRTKNAESSASLHCNTRLGLLWCQTSKLEDYPTTKISAVIPLLGVTERYRSAGGTKKPASTQWPKFLWSSGSLWITLPFSFSTSERGDSCWCKYSEEVLFFGEEGKRVESERKLGGRLRGLCTVR